MTIESKAPIWYLNKVDDDGHDVYGPVNLDNLRDWAMSAKISPLDRVSCDGQKSWDRAPMIPELHMDWLVEVSENFLYGPNTVGTILEFITNGEINENAWVINCTDGTRSIIRDNPAFKNAPRRTPINFEQSARRRRAPHLDLSPIEMQKRILELEALVLQQKRTIIDWQSRHQVLRAKYSAATGQDG